MAAIRLTVAVCALCVVMVAISPDEAATIPARQIWDSRSIVFGRSIGQIRLGQTRDQVEYLYGDSNVGNVELLDDYFPRGTKYYGKWLYRMTYRLHGGLVKVSYVDNRVKIVETTSSYYRTVSGIGVGSAIPLGCVRNRYGTCEYRWRGFVYEGDCGKSWLRGNSRVLNVLVMRQGRVRRLMIGDPQVILYCF